MSLHSFKSAEPVSLTARYLVAAVGLKLSRRAPKLHPPGGSGGAERRQRWLSDSQIEDRVETSIHANQLGYLPNREETAGDVRLRRFARIVADAEPLARHAKD